MCAYHTQVPFFFYLCIYSFIYLFIFVLVYMVVCVCLHFFLCVCEGEWCRFWLNHLPLRPCHFFLFSSPTRFPPFLVVLGFLSEETATVAPWHDCVVLQFNTYFAQHALQNKGILKKSEPVPFRPYTGAVKQVCFLEWWTWMMVFDYVVSHGSSCSRFW